MDQTDPPRPQEPSTETAVCVVLGYD
ncbi:hypothetical protein MIPYR_10298 [uncultured Microbacterium sp.]|uniref:Uncharacterized protein n=1 Tax=uncultured Microbacterium sp. TaxID=191216 RepID=A0A1Y5NUN3_9MICO|nr:hypothetical protein MIPYR_10298 [uncultured Microbacterium sp.]